MGIIEPNHLSLGFVEALYADYLKNPASVSADWRSYFQSMDGAAAALNGQALLVENRRQTITLRAIEQRLAALQPFDLDTLEQAYLDGLYRECNRLPLATAEEPPDAVRSRPSRLQRVYVDLATTATPRLDDVLTRLGVPAAKRSAARRQLLAALQEPRGAMAASSIASFAPVPSGFGCAWKRLPVFTA